MLEGELLTIAGKPAFIFLPAPAKRQTPQPWVLYAPTLLPNYPDEHERWMHEQLVDAGIAVAGIDVGEAYGSPQGNQGLSALVEYLVDQRQFSSKPCLLGRSRGGLWVSSWAAENPQHVSGIAGIYPVFDLRSYPGLQQASRAYQLDEKQLESNLEIWNPISKAGKLASAGIPMYIIHGMDDAVVPIAANSQAMQRAYQSKPGNPAFSLQAVPSQGHNFWPGFFRDRGLLDFVIGRAEQAAQR